MWRWGGLVAVLTDQASTHSRLTGLDAATGGRCACPAGACSAARPPPPTAGWPW
jgi:hypothetical protein